MSLHGHEWPFCITAGPERLDPDTGRYVVPINLCDPHVCPCWYHDTREEIAA